MNNSTPPSPVTEKFNIHEKLNKTKSHWSYCKYALPHQKEANFEFDTILIDGPEYAIYERCGDYFILVDFFKSYDEACQEAKSIIDNHPDIKQVITHRTNKH